MRKTALTISILLVLFSCKTERKIIHIEPEYVLKKWSKAIKNLDYERYVECEVHPKPYEEFLNIYKDYYYEEMRVNAVDKILEKTEDDDGSTKYDKCELIFDCVVVNRKNHKAQKRINGHVDFIKYIDLPKSKQGWLMFNRTLIETNL